MIVFTHRNRDLNIKVIAAMYSVTDLEQEYILAITLKGTQVKLHKLMFLKSWVVCTGGCSDLNDAKAILNWNILLVPDIYRAGLKRYLALLSVNSARSPFLEISSRQS